MKLRSLYFSTFAFVKKNAEKNTPNLEPHISSYPVEYELATDFYPQLRKVSEKSNAWLEEEIYAIHYLIINHVYYSGEDTDYFYIGSSHWNDSLVAEAILRTSIMLQLSRDELIDKLDDLIDKEIRVEPALLKLEPGNLLLEKKYGHYNTLFRCLAFLNNNFNEMDVIHVDSIYTAVEEGGNQNFFLDDDAIQIPEEAYQLSL